MDEEDGRKCYYLHLYYIPDKVNAYYGIVF